jgi:peptidoglycan/xylan/chitin deacetylase (PgdA/CDA1 family)
VPVPRPETLVLCYHGISPTWPAPTTVRPDRFREQLESLLGSGWVGATVTDALTSPPAVKSLVVTFDDAHRSVLELAKPVLDELGIPATVYVPTDYAGTDRLMAWAGYDVWEDTEHADELRCLTWDELRGLADDGWEIGSHTCSHPFLTRLDDDALERELTVSKEICEREMGRPCVSIAYPYGDCDDRVTAATRRAGYGLGLTVPTRSVAPLPLLWPRVAVYWDDTTRRLRLRAWRRAHRYVDGALVRLRPQTA